MKLTPAFLSRLLAAVRTTRADEVSCADCDIQLSIFAEQTLAGRDAAEAMPLLADHLARCPDCREEFEALLEALRAIEPRRPFFGAGRRGR